MSRININTRGVSDAGSSIRSAKEEVRCTRNGVYGTKNSISSQIRTRNNIEGRLNDLNNRLGNIEDKMNRINNMSNQAVTTYQNNEEKITNKAKLFEQTSVKNAKVSKNSSKFK